MKAEMRTFIDRDLHFPEGLRWHNGELWFSDFGTRRVWSADTEGNLTLRAFVGGQPSGLGFLPDNTAVVASTYDRNVLAITTEGLKLVGSPGKVVQGPTNDMAVDSKGRMYVTGFGYEAFYEAFDENRTTRIAMVDSDGNVSLQGGDLHMPNGIALSPDESTLIVSETTKNRLTAFDIASNGSLSGQRLFADLENLSPDGICVDAEGAVWVACWINGVLVRVRDGGKIDDEIVAAIDGEWVPSCALGGANGTTLYFSVSKTDIEKARRGLHEGVIRQVEVNVPAC